MPFRKDNSNVLASQSVVMRPLSDEKFVIDLKEAEQSLLELSMAAESLAHQVQADPAAGPLITSADVPLMTRIYESLIGGLPIFSPTNNNSSTTPQAENGTANASPGISLLEVGRHDNFNDCWVVIYDRVYDITDFLQSHPGGFDVILEHAGRDATIAFRGSGHSKDAVKMLKKFEIGILPMEERLYRHETPIFRWTELPE